jgi:methyl-accepting chemotaxis protein
MTVGPQVHVDFDALEAYLSNVLGQLERTAGQLSSSFTQVSRSPDMFGPIQAAQDFAAAHAQVQQGVQKQLVDLARQVTGVVDNMKGMISDYREKDAEVQAELHRIAAKYGIDVGPSAPASVPPPAAAPLPGPPA